MDHEALEFWSTSQDLSCTCDAEMGIAATRSWETSVWVTEWSSLQEDGTLFLEDSEQEEADNSEGEDNEIECQECFDKAEESDWDAETSEPPTFDPEEEKYRLVCQDCGQEIPFEFDGTYVKLPVQVTI